MPPLLTPHELLLKTPEPHSQISVHNLQTTLPLARDAWGRPSKPQPLLISCTLSLRCPFSSTSASDNLTNATIHYGILSKAILEACQEFRELCEDEVMPVPMHIKALVCYLQFYLTGCDTLPRIPSYVALPTNQNSTSASKGGKEGKPREPLVPCSMLNVFSLEVLLPKASLVGSGISLKGDFVYEEGHHGPSAYSMVLKLHELRVSAIIGVNGNERKAKQIVVCSVEMERWDRMVDAYNELEEIVVKSIEESTFQTLEALCTHLAHRIITYFLLPHYPLPSSPLAHSHQLTPSQSHPLPHSHLDTSHHPHQTTQPQIAHPLSQSLTHATWNYQRIRLSLSKPTAVTFADAPSVSTLLDSDPSTSQEVKELWQKREGGRKEEVIVPFPLEGRLDEWIERCEGLGSGE
ncbi:Dihydroneopterin aldolase-domain-containing protein [Hyaloscypha finlandica]|nr:Dihydroneopterin aldolase-domain-containing protein [Hyaloscypha finlandica]